MPRPSPRHANAPVLVAFGAAVRKTRLERGLSQEALAHEAGIDRSYVGSIERGDQNLGLVLAHQIALALQIPMSQLLAAAEL